MPNSDCSKCGKYKCKDGHVYVIELEESALDNKKFARDFNRDDFKSGITKCLYVGETTHAPQCRYNQHVAKRKKPRKMFICKCNKEQVEKPYIIKQEQKRTISTKQLAPSQLAPTGS